MARYRGPKTKKSRTFGESIHGYDKYFEKKKHPPGQHGLSKRRRQKSEYALQLKAKQKAKYTYGLLERQFAKLFDKANRREGKTGDILLQFLEARLDNTLFRLGLARTRRQARQLVNHKHIKVNGVITNVPSCLLRPGDVVSDRERSKNLEVIHDALNTKVNKFPWLEVNEHDMSGTFISYPDRDMIPENIEEQLIVELYSK